MKHGAIGVLIGVVLFMGGCCGSLKTAVNEHAKAINDSCQTNKELSRRCQAGDQAACPAVAASFDAVCASVQPILDAK
jgi:hypothetical protein